MKTYVFEWLIKQRIVKTSISNKEKIKQSYELANPWEQSKLEIERLSREFMEELADAINKEVERQIKERAKSKMTTRELLEEQYKSKEFKE